MPCISHDLLEPRDTVGHSLLLLLWKRLRADKLGDFFKVKQYVQENVDPKLNSVQITGTVFLYRHLAQWYLIQTTGSLRKSLLHRQGPQRLVLKPFCETAASQELGNLHSLSFGDSKVPTFKLF